MSASIFLVALETGSLAGDIPGLVTLGGGVSSKILTSLSSPELSELLEELSSSELSSLDESELELENANKVYISNNSKLFKKNNVYAIVPIRVTLIGSWPFVCTKL